MRSHFIRLVGLLLVCFAASAQAAAINGAVYSVIENATDGTSGLATSYIRFYNGMAATSSFSVRVIGSQSGTAYGQTATLHIPASASVQYSLSQLMVLAGSAAGAGTANGDTSYSIYVQDPDATTGYQHVVFDGVNSFFENASVCGNGLLTAATLAANKTVVIPNADTSTISGFPSEIVLHNYSTAAETAKVQLIDAGLLQSDGHTISASAGTSVGQTTVQVPANATVFKLVSDLQSAVNWTPSASQPQVNVVVSDSTGVTPTLAVQHTVLVHGSADPINMTSACALNNPTSAATFQGSIAGTNQQSATMLVNLQALTNLVTGQSIAAASSAPAGVEHAQSVVAKAQAASLSGVTLLLSNGSTVTLGGSYTATSGSVTLSGSGYTFTGTVSNGVLSGSYTGPNGTTGSFSTLSADQGTVTAYCGTYTENNGAGTGVFNLQIAANGMASGDSTPTAGDTEPGTFTGQANGSVVTVVHYAADGNPLNDTTVTTTIQNGKVSGSFPTGAGGVGTFSGGVCALPSS